jgi:hypothetical protein
MSARTNHVEPVKAELPTRATYAGRGLFWLGIVLVAAGYLAEPHRMAFANIVGYLFLVSIGVGSIFMLGLEHLSGAVWSVPIRRVTEFLSGLSYVLPFAAVPVLFHLHDVFHWAHADALAADDVLAGKAPYLNIPFFLARFVAFSLLWMLFAWLFSRFSFRQDQTKDPKYTVFSARLAPIFMPVFAISITFIAVDWAMSLEPHWYSTIFGVYYFSGTVLAAFSATTYIVIRLMENGSLPDVTRDHLYSLGAWLFVFVNFWAYIAFSQFMLIWYANLPEETVWFLARWHNGWEYVSILLIIVHFAVPYGVLLSQDAKMDPKRLKFIALWILFAHLLDLYWLVLPTVSPSASVSWVDLGFPVLTVGTVLLLLSFKMKRHSLTPIGDPKWERGKHFHL